MKLESVITGLTDNSQKDLIVYPNPTTGLVTVGNASAMNITVYNVTGSQVVKAEKNVTQIDLSNFPSGIYLVKFSDQEKTFQKFVLTQITVKMTHYLFLRTQNWPIFTFY